MSAMLLSTAIHLPLLPVPPSSTSLLVSFPPRRKLLLPCTRSPLRIKSQQQQRHAVSSQPSRWESFLAIAASLYPVYVTVGGVVAFVKPSAFAWFVQRGPSSYSCALGFIMLAMGLTLKIKDFFTLLLRRPLAILFGCAAQYTIMPTFGAIVSKALGLSPSYTAGLILLASCPGGTASNVVTLIAQGDVPLSIVMTACTTLSAVLLTPFITKVVAGAIVPVDAIGLSISTLQVVVAPILLGSYMQTTFPKLVRVITPFAPLLAVLTSSLLASSVFSENLVRLRSSLIASSNGDVGRLTWIQQIFSGDLGPVIMSVVLLHFAGFLVGYMSSAICGFKERQRRAISIEVGMQNSSLGVVLATTHFTSPLVALPCAMSAVIMNIMGSSLGLIWRYMDPCDDEVASI